MRRQLVPASRLVPGDQFIDPSNGTVSEVNRVTGSPGRRSSTSAPLVRVFCTGQTEFIAVRSDAPVSIRPRLTKASADLVVGDVVRLPDDLEYRSVVRITGSPGRRSPDTAPLLRLFVEGAKNFTAVRADTQIAVQRPEPTSLQ